MLVRAVIHALEQRTGEANQQVVVLLAVLRHADPARQRNGGVAEGHVIGQLGRVRHLLKDLEAVRAPGRAGVHAAGEHRGHDGGSVHVHRLDVVHGHAGLVEGVLEDILGGRAGGVGHNLALQVFHRGNALGGPGGQNFINIGEGYLARGLHRAVIGQLHQRFRGHVFPKPAVHTGLFPGGQRPLRQPEQPSDAALIVLLLGQPLDMALCLFIGIYAILQPTRHHLFQIAQLLFALFPAVGSCHQQVFGAQLQRTE